VAPAQEQIARGKAGEMGLFVKIPWTIDLAYVEMRYQMFRRRKGAAGEIVTKRFCSVEPAIRICFGVG